MYRKVSDFIADWKNAQQGTVQVLESLSDEKLNQAIVEGHSTLGWLGWHLATSPAFFASIVGLKVQGGDPKQVPEKAEEIVAAYKQMTDDIQQQAETHLTDDQLSEEFESFAGKTTRGNMLRALIDHQTHHRGQMTVLLRQADLPVPGVMGPTQEQSNS
ncbi:DinB family protein [Gracilibacillus caseinilyticus]|uniref:DinB family protein n=1 Tax=Gracilibacillus caseinilyticus TaxID=2932256 RepID=A0ABY4EZW2_9BACI|nr:DinB family protein [Gracilibacillus caseinilyticus]UOQ49942.1 DinB family protein [Gracilibacillus caseinilyticus]